VSSLLPATLSARALCPRPLPYTTLFRSLSRPAGSHGYTRFFSLHPVPGRSGVQIDRHGKHLRIFSAGISSHDPLISGSHTPFLRSEEHTSELQSRFDLVCRLLLEKKKIT